MKRIFYIFSKNKSGVGFYPELERLLAIGPFVEVSFEHPIICKIRRASVSFFISNLLRKISH
jgi:hypothetical protein